MVKNFFRIVMHALGVIIFAGLFMLGMAAIVFAMAAVVFGSMK